MVFLLLSLQCLLADTLLTSDEIAIILVGDKLMPCQAAPGGQIYGHGGIGGPDLKGLPRRHRTHKRSDIIQRTEGAPPITSIVEEVRFEYRAGFCVFRNIVMGT
jgi:hypothetical protein